MKKILTSAVLLTLTLFASAQVFYPSIIEQTITKKRLKQLNAKQQLSNKTFVLNESFESGNASAEPIVGWTHNPLPGDFWASLGPLSYNREARTGQWYTYLRYNKNSWMFKEVNLEAGTNYKFSLWHVTCGNPGISIEVGLASEATPDNISQTLIELKGVNNTVYTEETSTFTVNQTGTYYLGVHGILTGSDCWYLTIDDISIITEYENDAAITSITAPSGILPTGNYEIKVNLQNNGINDLTNVQIEWVVDGITNIYDWTGNLAQGEHTEVVLGNHEFTDAGTYPIEASAILASDEDATNNAATSSIEIKPPLTIPLFTGFEEDVFPPQGWEVTTTNGSGFGWEAVSFSPIFEGENVARFYTWMAAGTISNLTSPFIEIGADEDILLSFYTNYNFSTGDETLHNAELYLEILDIYNNILETTSNLIEEQYETGWLRTKIPLTQYAGQVIKIRYKAVSDEGTYNISLDNISLTEQVDNDLKLYPITNKLISPMNSEAEITCIVENVGRLTQEKVVSLLANDNTIQTQTITIEPLQTLEVTFNPLFETSGIYNILIQLPEDATLDNNQESSQLIVVTNNQLSEEFEDNAMPISWSATEAWTFSVSDESIEELSASVSQKNGDDIALLSTPYVVLNQWTTFSFEAKGVNNTFGYGSSKLQLKYRLLGESEWQNIGDLYDFAQNEDVNLFVYDLTSLPQDTIQFGFESTSDFEFSFEGVDFSSAILIDNVVCDQIANGNINFTVLSDQSPVEGVNIQIGNNTINSAADGTASIELPLGNHEFTATHELYIPITEQVELFKPAIDKFVNLNELTSLSQTLVTKPVLHPNPFETTVYVQNYEQYKQLTIINSIGQPIKTIKLNSETINTSTLEAGFYLFVFETKSGQIHRTVMLKD